jgi:hypothetical protein
MKQLLPLIAILALVAACQSTPKRIAYNTLASTATAVDTAMQVAGDLYKAGEITEADKADVLLKYDKYQTAMNQAIMLLEFNYQAITPGTVAGLAATLIETVNQFTSAP